MKIFEFPFSKHYEQWGINTRSSCSGSSGHWRNFSEQFCSAEPQARSSQWTALTWYISFDWVVPWFSLVHSLTIEQIEVQVKYSHRRHVEKAKGHSRKLQYDFTSEQLPKYADAESFLQNWFYFSNVHFFAQTKKISSSQDVAGSGQHSTDIYIARPSRPFKWHSKEEGVTAAKCG